MKINKGTFRYPALWAMFGTVLVVVIGVVLWVLSLFNKSGSTTSTTSASGASSFVTLGVLAVIAIIAYRYLKGSWPDKKFSIGFFGLLLFNWIWWGISPETYDNWRQSNVFWPIIIALFFTGVIAASTEKVAIIARKVLVAEVLFCIMFGMFSYGSKNLCILGFGGTCVKQVSQPNVQSPVTSSAVFAGNARDNWNGPDKVFVMDYWKDDSTMSDIAAAESRFNQYADSTNRTCDGVLRHKNDNGTEDLGVMQINSIHKDEAEKLGFSLCTLEGNLKYARVLKEREGYAPWNSSRYAWQYHCLEKAGCNENATLADASGNVQFGNSTAEIIDLAVKVPADGTPSQTILTGSREHKLWFSNPDTVKHNLIAIKNGSMEILLRKDSPVDLGLDLERIAFKSADGDSLTMYVCRVRGRQPPAGAKCVM